MTLNTCAKQCTCTSDHSLDLLPPHIPLNQNLPFHSLDLLTTYIHYLHTSRSQLRSADTNPETHLTKPEYNSNIPKKAEAPRNNVKHVNIKKICGFHYFSMDLMIFIEILVSINLRTELLISAQNSVLGPKSPHRFNAFCQQKSIKLY